jgi:hypothetical protein
MLAKAWKGASGGSKEPPEAALQLPTYRRSHMSSSDFLFAHPSVLSGIGRVLDLGGVFDDYNVSETPMEADARALRADWAAVGKDLIDAMRAAEPQVAQVRQACGQ